MLLQKLNDQGLIQPNKWLIDSTAMLVRMGSTAYGVSNNDSDIDIYGFCIPPREMVFPHSAGFIQDFGTQPEKFGQWQQHHVITRDGKTEYDFSVYNIVKFFHLCMENNPNIVDSLFVPENCILHSTTIGDYVRENRKLFLHKGSWHKFKGYAFAQMSRFMGTRENMKVVKMARFMEEHNISNINMKQTLENQESGRDSAISHLSAPEFAEYKTMFSKLTDRNIKTLEEGSDTKAQYHIVRLMLEVEQILTEGDLDLQRNKELLKSIRRGEWSVERLEEYYNTKLVDLETVYTNSKLPHSPDEQAIKQVLINCLEQYYGDLGGIMKRDTTVDEILNDIRKVLEKHGG